MASCDWLTSWHCADTFRNVTNKSAGPNLDRFLELVYRPNCKYWLAMHCILGHVRDNLNSGLTHFLDKTLISHSQKRLIPWPCFTETVDIAVFQLRQVTKFRSHWLFKAQNTLPARGLTIDETTLDIMPDKVWSWLWKTRKIYKVYCNSKKMPKIRAQIQPVTQVRYFSQEI